MIVLALVLAIAFPVVQWLFVCVPADVAYQNAFGGDVVMAYDAAGFEGIEQQINTIWTRMNQTWPGDHRQIYNSPFPWDRHMSNTLYAQDLYFNKLLVRLDGYENQWQTIQAGKVIVQGDWYQTTLDKLREDLKSGGGLDWAIDGAYYLQFYPGAYWAIYYSIGVWVTCIIVGIVGSALPEPEPSRNR